MSEKRKHELKDQIKILEATQLIVRNGSLQIFADKMMLIQEIEFMNGGSLLNFKENLAKNNLCLKIEHLAKISYDLTLGLAFIHKRNILHRDISMDNCLIKYTGDLTDFQIKKVVISDFDNSRFFPDEENRKIDNLKNVNLTQSDQCGKPTFRPPEGIILANSYDLKWDIYQMGLVLWGLLCGKIDYRSGGTPYDINEEYLKKMNGPNNEWAPNTADQVKRAILWEILVFNTGPLSDFEKKKISEFTTLTKEEKKSLIQKQKSRLRQILEKADQILRSLTKRPKTNEVNNNNPFQQRKSRGQAIEKRISESYSGDNKKILNNFLKYPALKHSDDIYRLSNNDAIKCPQKDCFLNLLSTMLAKLPEERCTAEEAVHRLTEIFKHQNDDASYEGILKVANFDEMFFKVDFTKFTKEILNPHKIDVDKVNITRKDSSGRETVEIVSVGSLKKKLETQIQECYGNQNVIQELTLDELQSDIYVPTRKTKRPNSHIKHLMIKSIKMAVEKMMDKLPEGWVIKSDSINGIYYENQAGETSFIHPYRSSFPFDNPDYVNLWKQQFYEQLRSFLPFLWNTEEINANFHSEKGTTLPERLDGNLLFQQGSGDKAYLFSDFVSFLQQHSLVDSHMTETKRKEWYEIFIWKCERTKQFMKLHGFDMMLLHDWKPANETSGKLNTWFDPKIPTDSRIPSSENTENSLMNIFLDQESAKKQLISGLKGENTSAFCFKMRRNEKSEKPVYVYFVVTFEAVDREDEENEADLDEEDFLDAIIDGYSAMNIKEQPVSRTRKLPNRNNNQSSSTSKTNKSRLNKDAANQMDCN